VTRITVATCSTASGEHQPCRRCAAASGVAIGVLRHQLFDLAAQLDRHVDLGRVGDHRGRLVQVDRIVPAGRARSVRKARHGRRATLARVSAHERLRLGEQRLLLGSAHLSTPPRIGSSIATEAIMSAM
jgi:hypothetical protein